MKTSDDVAKTMSLQRLIKRRHNEMLQLRRFYNVIATLQRRCNPALSNRKQIQANMSTSDQRCFNFVDQRWNNANPTLKQLWNNIGTALSWRCFNVSSTLVPVGLVISTDL